MPGPKKSEARPVVARTSPRAWASNSSVASLARSSPLRLQGRRGVSSSKGTFSGRPYMYRQSSTTSRAPARIAASRTPRLSGGSSSSQRWYSAGLAQS